MSFHCFSSSSVSFINFSHCHYVSLSPPWSGLCPSILTFLVAIFKKVFFLRSLSDVSLLV